MKLQNKRIKNVQIQIFRHITLIDIPIIIVLFLVSASISFALPENLFILVKMLISTAFFLVWTVPLIKYYKNWGLKGYKIIWYIALYLA
ncbi:transferase, partial [Mesomycoplasma ovipneumoniae]